MAAIRRELSSQLARTPNLNLDPWNDVRGAIIVGKVSSLSAPQLESFVRYRSALSTVTILGYDEVLERLEGLLAMLSGSRDSVSSA